MEKNYREIEFSIGSNIERAVNELSMYKDKEKLVCGSFNGTMLYSDTVTMDGAYQQITGKTKAEFDKEQEDWREDYKRREKEYQDSVPSLVDEWVIKGKEILTADKWDYWKEIIPIRLKDLYHGMELGCCLDIVKILNNGGTLDEAKAEINKQDHSGMSYGLVRVMVKEFCNRGNEFYEYTRI